MKKTILLKKLLAVFLFLLVVNIAYEGMRFYSGQGFLIKEIISKSVLEIITLLFVWIEFSKK